MSTLYNSVELGTFFSFFFFLFARVSRDSDAAAPCREQQRPSPHLSRCTWMISCNQTDSLRPSRKSPALDSLIPSPDAR